MAQRFEGACGIEDVEGETCLSIERKARDDSQCLSVIASLPQPSEEDVAACHTAVNETMFTEDFSEETGKELDSLLNLLAAYKDLLKVCPPDEEDGDQGPADHYPEDDYHSSPESANCCQYSEAGPGACNNNTMCNT